MKNIMRVIPAIMYAIMLTTCVYTENTEQETFQTSIDDKFSVNQTYLISNTNNSDLNVNVIELSDDTQSVSHNGTRACNVILRCPNLRHIIFQ